MDINKLNIALSLTSRTINYMLSDGLDVMSRDLMERPNLLELRLDYINPDELTKENIFYLIRGLKPTPVIATIRHKTESPPNDFNAGFKGSEKQRYQILHDCVLSGANYIDVEYKHFLDINLNGNETKLILSNHDFIRTPSTHALSNLYDEMHSFRKNAIIKIATTSQNQEDNENILKLIKNHSGKNNLIALAMGENGKDTRVKGPLYGSIWTYAYNDPWSASAPGQMSVENIRKTMMIAAKYIKQE